MCQFMQDDAAVQACLQIEGDLRHGVLIDGKSTSLRDILIRIQGRHRAGQIEGNIPVIQAAERAKIVPRVETESALKGGQPVLHDIVIVLCLDAIIGKNSGDVSPEDHVHPVFFIDRFCAG